MFFLTVVFFFLIRFPFCCRTIFTYGSFGREKEGDIVAFHGAILLPCENEIVEEAHSYKELG